MKMLEALFVVTAKAAPAATTSASAGGDWKWLVPVATLILGFGLKWLQDYVAEQRRREHETALRREQRFDQLRMRRIDAERSNLLLLQPLVVSLLRAGRKLRIARNRAETPSGYWFEVEVDERVRLEPSRIVAEILPIRARLHTAGVVSEFDGFIKFFWEVFASETATEARQAWDIAEELYKPLVESIGNAIRELEDENLQLTDPPAR